MIDKKDKMNDKWRSALSPFEALLNYAKKEEIAHRKLQKTRRAYTKERTKQRERLNREVAGLDRLMQDKSIDEDTHARLNKILKIVYEQKLQETRKKYGFKTLTPAQQPSEISFQPDLSP